MCITLILSVCPSLCMFGWLFVCMFVCLYSCMYVCIFVCTCMHGCISYDLYILYMCICVKCIISFFGWYIQIQHVIYKYFNSMCKTYLPFMAIFELTLTNTKKNGDHYLTVDQWQWCSIVGYVSRPRVDSYHDFQTSSCTSLGGEGRPQMHQCVLFSLILLMCKKHWETCQK